MPITMPTMPGFRRSAFYLETNTQVFASPLSNATQRVLLAGARWRAEFTLPRMLAGSTEADRWQAFLMQLEGMANTFYAYDPDKQTPRGIATGTPLVAGASQTGSSLNTDGWTASQTGILRAGDYFTVNGELKQVTADANSDGSGAATISFKPALRSSPSDNAPLTVQQAACTMILTDDMQARWDSDHNGVYEEKTFGAVEVFS